VWYLTSAAASGAWWTGDWVGSPPGYTVLSCLGDRLDWTFHTFPWQPHLEPEDKREAKLIAEHEAFEQEQQRLLEIERAGRKPWPRQQNFMRR
jgi:ribulose kinase